MYRLISFLSTYRNVFIFLILEMAAFMMLVRYNDHQRHQFGDGMLEVAGVVQSWNSGIQDYRARARNYDSRVREIGDLKQELDSLRNVLESYQILIGADSIDRIRIAVEKEKTKEDFRYIPCRVVKNNVSGLYNYITIDKGKQVGIRENMGVVSPNGIVGKVVKVSDNYSLVLSALNLSFKLTLQTVTGDSLGESIGVYEWDGSSTNEARLTYVPNTVKLDTGHQVVTSGFSTVFPVGYPVGEVVNVRKNPEDGFYDAGIRLTTDFHRLGTVYVIESLHKAELDSLDQSLELP